MAKTTINTPALLRPEQVDQLLVAPTFGYSVAAQVLRIFRTNSTSARLPVVTADPVAEWVAEGAEITPSDPAISEIVITPPKVAGLTIISRELADDSSPEAAQAVGDGLARDLARRIDQALFSSIAAPAPDGLADLTGTSTVAAPAAWADLDPFEEALSEVEQVGGTVTSWVANPADALAIAQLKTNTSDSTVPLLATDPAMPARRILAGRPLFVSPYVTGGTVWSVDQSRAVLVMREDTRIEVDNSVFFTSDRVAVRGVMRVGFGFPHPASVAQITLTP